MSLAGELEAVIEVKASADKVHEVFSCRPHIVTSISPQSVQSYAGNPQIVKELIEVVDNENYITIFKLIEGNVLEMLYKSFYSVAKVTQKDDHEGGSLVRFTYKYERKNENVPDLESKVLEMMINIVKNIDAYLIQHEEARADDTDQVLLVNVNSQEIESPSQ
ncbi:MLP-like protein 28 [Citrus sinensis]|nr:MLP-like protein 28 [Citrus sinensis]